MVQRYISFKNLSFPHYGNRFFNCCSTAATPTFQEYTRRNLDCISRSCSLQLFFSVLDVKLIYLVLHLWRFVKSDNTVGRNPVVMCQTKQLVNFNKEQTYPRALLSLARVTNKQMWRFAPRYAQTICAPVMHDNVRLIAVVYNNYLLYRTTSREIVLKLNKFIEPTLSRRPRKYFSRRFYREQRGFCQHKRVPPTLLLETQKTT